MQKQLKVMLDDGRSTIATFDASLSNDEVVAKLEALKPFGTTIVSAEVVESPQERGEKAKVQMDKDIALARRGAISEGIDKAMILPGMGEAILKLSDYIAPMSTEETMQGKTPVETLPTTAKEVGPVLAELGTAALMAPYAAGSLVGGGLVGLSSKGAGDIAKSMVGDNLKLEEQGKLNMLQDYIPSAAIGAGLEGVAGVGKYASGKLNKILSETGAFPEEGFGTSISTATKQSFRKPFQSGPTDVVDMLETNLKKYKSNINADLFQLNTRSKNAIGDGTDNAARYNEEYKTLKAQTDAEIKQMEKDIERAKTDDYFALSKSKELQAENITGPQGEALRIPGRTLPTLKSMERFGASEIDKQSLRDVQSRLGEQSDILRGIKTPSTFTVSPAGLTIKKPELSLSKYYKLAELGKITKPYLEGSSVVASPLSNYIVNK